MQKYSALTKEIAVVGMSAIFPKASNKEQYWRNILTGQDCISDIPPGHWRVEDYFDPNPQASDKIYCRRGGFIPDIAFDPLAFGIPPNSLPATDTAQLLALVAAKQALDDAARPHGGKLKTPRKRISVILGATGAMELILDMASRLEYPKWKAALQAEGFHEKEAERVCARLASYYPEWQEASFPGLLSNVIAGRIAHKLNLGGSNFIVDAACASSLAALQISLDELAVGRADMVLTGGVDTFNTIVMYMCFSKTPALSPSEECRPFSKKADGTLIGEGIGILALKRLADAERDQDRIYAVIKGIGSSSDGKGKSVYAPVEEGQEKAIRQAYEQANFTPASVGLIEGHGTGTKSGDEVELAALHAVYGGSARTRPVCLGSVKSQIGHTKAAAGAAGLIKTILALHNGILPPTIKVEESSAALKEGSPFYLSNTAQPWLRGGKPRRAAVSSFGFGGTNFHVALEEHMPKNQGPKKTRALPTELVLLAAMNLKALRQQCEQFLQDPALSFAEGFTYLAQESHKQKFAFLPQRLAIVCNSSEELRDLLRYFLDNIQEPINYKNQLFYSVQSSPSLTPQVAFLFPGQGSQYVQMGNEIEQFFPTGVWDDVLTMSVGSQEDKALTDVVFPLNVSKHKQEQESLLRSTRWAQPAIATMSTGLLRIMQALGVQADYCIGHSLGELTALHAAGVMDFATLVTLARCRGELMETVSKETAGGMLAVSCGVETLAACLDLSSLTVANINGPQQTVLSGDIPAIERAANQLKDLGIGSTRLPVSHAFHSPLVAPVRHEFLQILQQHSFKAPSIEVLANTHGDKYPTDQEGIRILLAQQLASPVLFSQQVQNLYERGVRVFIELGPHSVLTSLVRANLTNSSINTIAFDRRGQGGLRSLWTGLAQLFIAGVPFDLTALTRSYEEISPSWLNSPTAATVYLNGANFGRPFSKHEDDPMQPPEANSTPSQHPTETYRPPAGSLPLSLYMETQRDALRIHAEFQRNMVESHKAFLKMSEVALQGLFQIAKTSGISSTIDADETFIKPSPVSHKQDFPPILPHAQLDSLFTTKPDTPSPSFFQHQQPSKPTPANTKPLDVTEMILSTIAEKTGYPISMLTFDMNLEGDLGIDSIKRVEIFSCLSEKFSPLSEEDSSALSKLNTLGEIKTFFEHIDNASHTPSLKKKTLSLELN